MSLLRFAAHTTGIAVTASLIPLSGLLMVFVGPAWGFVCLGTAAAVLAWAAWWSRDKSGGER